MQQSMHVTLFTNMYDVTIMMTPVEPDHRAASNSMKQIWHIVATFWTHGPITSSTTSPSKISAAEAGPLHTTVALQCG